MYIYGNEGYARLLRLLAIVSLLVQNYGIQQIFVWYFTIKIGGYLIFSNHGDATLPAFVRLDNIKNCWTALNIF